MTSPLLLPFQPNPRSQRLRSLMRCLPPVQGSLVDLLPTARHGLLADGSLGFSAGGFFLRGLCVRLHGFNFFARG